MKMTTDNLFSFLTSQDEYHCFLEKIMMRATKFYFGATPSIQSILVENYIQMEKAYFKEDYNASSFYYIKQVEEIVSFGLNAVGFHKITDDLREDDKNNWKLSSFGEEKLNYEKNTNKVQIDNLKKGQILVEKDYQWRVKLNLFKHYFDTKNTDFNYDELFYYKRNQHSHANSASLSAKELQFEQEFPTVYSFMNKSHSNLKKHFDALMLPQNR